MIQPLSTLCNVVSTLFQRHGPRLYQRCATLKTRRQILFHFQRQINVTSTLIQNVEITLTRHWNVGWVNTHKVKFFARKCCVWTTSCRMAWSIELLPRSQTVSYRECFNRVSICISIVHYALRYWISYYLYSVIIFASSLILHVFSHILSIFSQLIYIQCHLIYVQSHPIYIQSAYIYSV